MGVFSRRWAKTALPVASLVYTANGLLGEYFHARGVARRPGGWRLASYNVPMGPPIAAPGLMTLVGGMGVLAALLRREAEWWCVTCAVPTICPTCGRAASARHPGWLPRQRRGVTPQMIGRYPDYDVFDARRQPGTGRRPG